MPKWSGEYLNVKREQAVAAMRRAFQEVRDNEDWIRLTEIAWQLMNEKARDAQLDIIRHERFVYDETVSGKEKAEDRLNQFLRYVRALRALNFFLKCFDVDWGAFADTAIALAEGRIDVVGLDGKPGRSKRRDPGDSDRSGNDPATACIEDEAG